MAKIQLHTAKLNVAKPNTVDVDGELEKILDHEKRQFAVYYNCDRCGKEIEVNVRKSGLKPLDNIVTIGPKAAIQGLLCEDCMHKLIEWYYAGKES